MIQPGIRKGLTLLVRHDAYLLLMDVNERSITHRLGMYYQFIFQEWDVDCEFNKNLGYPKSINIDPHIFLDKMASLLESDGAYSGKLSYVSRLREEHISVEDIDLLREQLREPERLRYDAELDVMYFVLTLRNGSELRKLIYPDIIVHKRGSKNNYIVIEAKKSSNTNKVSRAYDIVKLVTLVNDKEYNYKRGYFIDLPTGDQFNRHKRFNFRKLELDRKVYDVTSL